MSICRWVWLSMCVCIYKLISKKTRIKMWTRSPQSGDTWLVIVTKYPMTVSIISALYHLHYLITCSLFHSWDILKIWSKYVQNFLYSVARSHVDRQTNRHRQTNRAFEYMTYALVKVIIKMKVELKVIGWRIPVGGCHIFTWYIYRTIWWFYMYI